MQGRWNDSNISRFPNGASSARPRPAEPFGAFSPAEWYLKDPPPYDWMVEGCLLRGTVGMLSGDGGIGKSLLMQQLLTAAAIGKDWLGLKTQKCKGFGFFCEDDKDELHRRQARINEHYDCEYPDVETLYVSRVGMENVLVEFDRRTDRALPTPLWDQLRTAVLDFGAQLVVIDTIADAYGGNEIVRNQVRRFITELRRLAVQIQGCVILTAHPSLQGMNNGTGLSGSTAWNNSVRSRLYLTKPRKKEEDQFEEEDGTNERILKTMKNNQGPGHGILPLIWENGVFVRNMPSEVSGLVGSVAIESYVFDRVMDLTKSGTRMSPDRFSRTYVTRAVEAGSRSRRYSFNDLDAAKDRLLEKGRLVIVAAKGNDRRLRTVIKPAGVVLPEEGKPE